MDDGKIKKSSPKEPEAAEAKTPEGTRVVVLPVYSTKVLAGLETDETMARIKSVQRKKRRARYRRDQRK